MDYFSYEELKNIFLEAKTLKSNKPLDKIYTKYLPLLDEYCPTFGVLPDEGKDIYNMVISTVCDNVLNDACEISEFESTLFRCLKNEFEKAENRETIKIETLPKEVKSTYEEELNEAIDAEYRRVSLLYVVNLLSKLLKNPDMLKKYGFDKEHLKVFMDYYGLNKEKKEYSAKELSKKYNIPEKRITAMIVATTSKIKNIERAQQYATSSGKSL